MRFLLLFLIACGGTSRPDKQPALVGQCPAVDSVGYADPSAPGVHADPAAMAGDWTVIAPTCLKGELHDGVWTCGNVWTGSIGTRPDAYYPGGLILTPWPDPRAWQYASEARVIYASPAEVRAVLMDGYWGFMGAVIFFCR